MKEADDFDMDAFGFSDEERGPEIERSSHYDDLLNLERGDSFTIGNRKPVYYVIGALTPGGIAKGQTTKLVVKYNPAGTSPEDAAEAAAKKRKTYLVKSPPTGVEGEVGAFGKDEDNKYTILMGKTGFVMNITKSAETEKWIKVYRAENAGRGIATDAIEGGIYFFPRRETAKLWAGNHGNVIEKEVNISNADYQAVPEGNAVRYENDVVIRTDPEGSGKWLEIIVFDEAFIR